MKSQKPKASPQRSAGKTNRPKDDPSSALESGDPKRTGRSRGHIIDETGAPAGRRNDSRNPTEADRESGRHGTL